MRQPLKEATADVSTDRGLRRAGRQAAFDRRYTDERGRLQASAASHEMAELRPHAEGCGTTFTVYTGYVAEV